MDVYICQKLSNCTNQFVQFVVCWLYLNETTKLKNKNEKKIKKKNREDFPVVNVVICQKGCKKEARHQNAAHRNRSYNWF